MNSSTKPEAFSFETEFSTKGDILDTGNSHRRYRQDEVDALCAEARQAGVQSVQAETERQIAASVDQIVRHLEPVMPFALDLASRMRREAAELAMTMARQLAGSALRQMPEEAVEASLSETLALLPDGLKLVLRVQPELVERIHEKIKARLPAGTEILVEDDPAAGPGSWKMTWDRGGFSHNPEELANRISGLIENHLNQPVEEQDDLFARLA